MDDVLGRDASFRRGDPVSEVQRPNNPGEAWCSVHKMHPNDCFEMHRPDIKEVRGVLEPEAHRKAIEDRHRYLQEHPEEIREVKPGEKMDPSDA